MLLFVFRLLGNDFPKRRDEFFIMNFLIRIREDVFRRFEGLLLSRPIQKARPSEKSL